MVGGFRAQYDISNDMRVVFPKNPDGLRSIVNLFSGKIFISRKQFWVGRQLLLPSLVRKFLYHTEMYPVHMHPNTMHVLMGCKVLNRLYALEFSVLEVLFMYIVRLGVAGRFSLSAQCHAFQFVTKLPNSRKRWLKENVLASRP